MVMVFCSRPEMLRLIVETTFPTGGSLGQSGIYTRYEDGPRRLVNARSPEADRRREEVMWEWKCKGFE